MKQVAFIEVGMGIDLHGQDVTVACTRAIRNAIGHNSMPGISSFLPNGDLHEMRVHVSLAVPFEKENVDIEKVKEELPYGHIEVEVVEGGLKASSGIILPEQGDKTDEMIIVIAVVTVGN